MRRDAIAAAGPSVPGSVGPVRANTSQLQVRVTGKCAAGSAIAAVDRAGNATGNPALAAEFATSGTQALTGTGAGTVASLGLPAGPSYLVLANPPSGINAVRTSSNN